MPGDSYVGLGYELELLLVLTRFNEAVSIIFDLFLDLAKGEHSIAIMSWVVER